MANERALGRRAAPDERDNNFPARTLVAAWPAWPYSWRYWTTGPVLDQGNLGQCVGAAWRQWMSTSPVRHENDALTMTEIYNEAQLVDEWADTPPMEGTSVRAGAKIMAARGHLVEYRWALTAQEIADWVLRKGSVVMGTQWMQGMFDPDEDGFVELSGGVVGGHAYLCTGFNENSKTFRFINSWGKDWGENGRFRMTAEQVDLLMQRDGEACCAVEIDLP